MAFVISFIFFLVVLASSPYATPLNGTQLQSQEPMVLRAIPAIYPRIAAVAKESGTVIIEVKINPDGTVAETKAVDGHKLFRVAAEKSSRLWVFNPIAESNMSRTALLTFSFKLISKAANPEELLPVFMPPYGVETRATTPAYVFHKNVDPPNRKSKGLSKR